MRLLEEKEREKGEREEEESKGHSFLLCFLCEISLHRSCKQLFLLVCIAFWYGGVFSALCAFVIESKKNIKEGKKEEV